MSDWKIVIPEGGTNAVKNPCAGGTAGWGTLTGGTITLSNSAGYAMFGGYAWLYQGTADNAGIYFNLDSAVLGGTQAYITVYINGGPDTTWDWSTNDVDYATPALLGTVASTYKVYGLALTGTQVQAAGTLFIRQSANGASEFRIGFVQVEPLTYRTDPIMGNRDGCSWYGDEYNSRSIREAQSRAGGREYDLADYSLKVLDASGIGPVPVTHHIQEQALLSGATYIDSKPQMRDFVLRSVLTEAASMPAMHALMEDFWDLIKPDRVKGNQPFLLRYYGANASNPVEIACYADPLPDSLGHFRHHVTQVHLIAPDPFFYELDEANAPLTTSESDDAYQNYQAVLYKDGSWGAISSQIGSSIYAYVRDKNRRLYLGGAFGTSEEWDGNYIAYQIPSGADYALSTQQPDAPVYAMALAPDGVTLYAAGYFSAIGTIPNSAYIARYDGVGSWYAMGSGASAGGTVVLALAVGQDGKVYAGGAFGTMGGSANTKCIARWNGAYWGSVSYGVTGTIAAYGVNHLAVGLNGDIYAGGDFSQMGSVANTGCIARCDGTSWYAMGTGFGAPSSGAVNAMAVAPDGALYVLTDWSNYMQKWNGYAWSSVGPAFGSSDWCHMDIDDEGKIYVGVYTYTGVDGMNRRIMMFNGAEYIHMPYVMDGALYSAILCDRGDLFLGHNTAGTAYHSYQNTVTNQGTRSAFPKFYFKRAGGTAARLEYIKNDTTGKVIYMDYALLDGEEVVIDLTPGKKTVTSSYFGPVAGRCIKRGGGFADWCLLPGSNTVSVFVVPVGSPTITAYCNWRNTHWGASGAAA